MLLSCGLSGLIVILFINKLLKQAKDTLLRLTLAKALAMLFRFKTP